MTLSWTAEQIIKLAPDSGSAKAGKELANRRKWQTLGFNEVAAWGECQGSAKNPYQTEIFLEEPAYRCTCPSRKFPCKHSLGLFLLLVDQPEAFARPQAEPPAWVTEWLEKRSQKQEETQQAVAAPKSKPSGKAGQDRRADQRQAKVEAGLEELRLWVSDLVRQGLAAAQGQPYKFWDGMAARMVDAQAPGLARRLREMGGIVSTGTGWQERLLDRLAQLHLLLEGYRQLEQLPVGLQAEIRNQIGWTQSQEELLNRPGLYDRWLVVGQGQEVEERLKTRRTWLFGSSSRRAALVLQFAYGNQPMEAGLLPGSSLDSELVFFPGAYPLRAVVKPTPGRTYLDLDSWPGHSTILEAMEGYSLALAENPWLNLYPVMLNAIYPVRSGEGWQVRDESGRCLPVAANFSKGWPLMALSGGRPLGFFGTWDGSALTPYSAWVENRLIDFVGDM